MTDTRIAHAASMDMVRMCAWVKSDQWPPPQASLVEAGMHPPYVYDEPCPMHTVDYRGDGWHHVAAMLKEWPGVVLWVDPK